ncbi:stage V sporulation protein AA [Alkalihalobacillus sp. LMS39]|uniref:stage V sporulation protein AA n=1 Tax=Alkalihalobacillus sp. LMS39 TaxID=2924032 RepID=UPI001FB461E1|nr:stage V sporulation protein AA [Alkalihalobacillus sp. LMS39]UOE92448.1 stage V sporulation protein AA [Alkalihalobacillus sp. LMS39]
MNQEQSIYIKMRHRIGVTLNQTVTIHDIAQVSAHPSIQSQIQHLSIHTVKPEDKNFIVIDIMRIVRVIQENYPGLDIQNVGAAQTILEVQFEKKKIVPVYFVLIWLLLFVGAALAIMNFHEDVSMREVQQRIYTVITGEETDKPLLFQVPYSIGLGLGMILFFNHVFRKRINEEPSPLEVEMFNYDQDLEQYLIIHENKGDRK